MYNQRCTFIYENNFVCRITQKGLNVCFRNKKRLGAPILCSIWRLTVYNQGSVAMGAIVITLIKIPRMFLMYLNKK